MAYVKSTTEAVVQFFSDFISNEKKKGNDSLYNSETYLDYLSLLLDTILKLDSLKTFKAPLNNDYSAYRRHAGTNMVEDQTEQAAIYSFLSQANSILKGLNTAINKVTG
jgi:hypothetical protein